MATIKEDMAHFTTLASIKTPQVMRAVFFILLAAIIITIAFLIYVPWVQTTSGRGVVTTLSPNERRQDINALVPGRIEEWYVRDGSTVKKGDPIVRIADIDPQLIERLGAEVIGCAFVVDLPDLGGRKKLEAMGMEVHALCQFEGL